jgi:uncharacterized membrane protein (GlpM family)
MVLLILKLTLVPLVLAGVTLAGRRFGPGVAGRLAGLPVVAGPIVLLLAHEQGVDFGQAAATAAIAAIAALLAFGVAYSHLARRWAWPIALTGALGVWLLAALALLGLPQTLLAALAAAGTALLLTPRLLPATSAAPTAPPQATTGDDLPWRMLAGALLTLTVTGVAVVVGDAASGLLAAFPVLGSVLAVSTHRSRGAAAVATLYRGMVRGLRAFAAFFGALALGLPQVGLVTAAAGALVAALLVATIAA